MNFHESLEQTLNAVPGALALSLIGYDGIGIESVARGGAGGHGQPLGRIDHLHPGPQHRPRRPQSWAASSRWPS